MKRHHECRRCAGSCGKEGERGGAGAFTRRGDNLRTAPGVNPGAAEDVVKNTPRVSWRGPGGFCVTKESKNLGMRKSEVFELDRYWGPSRAAQTRREKVDERMKKIATPKVAPG